MSRAPLAGKVVVLTRPREQGRGLKEALEALGASVIDLPAIEIVPPEDPGPLDAALRELEAYQWVVFTSANAVRAVASRLRALDLPLALGRRGPRLAVVGAATAEALQAALPGETIALRPRVAARAAGLLEAFKEVGVEGSRILLPLSSRGRDDLPQGLAVVGAMVDCVVAYRTSGPRGLAVALRECLVGNPDLFVFASPSAVETLASAAGGRLAERPAVVIGPTTEEAARRAGLKLRAVAKDPSDAGLRSAVLAAFGLTEST
ncbi:MAG TPA: uroporphyrinogen-III synthase [Vicinamibacteria bacterium]|nr:uroporphyrinogen-III synthase [Vicinamibacteria bacterium]